MAAPPSEADLESSIRNILDGASLEGITQRLLRTQVSNSSASKKNLSFTPQSGCLLARTRHRSTMLARQKDAPLPFLSVSCLTTPPPHHHRTHHTHQNPTTTHAQLEGKFGQDLTAQKALIKELTIRILAEKTQPDEEEEEDEVVKKEEDDGVKEESGSEEEEEEEEEEEQDEKPIKKKASGFNKELEWSDAMADFLGTKMCSRPQVRKGGEKEAAARPNPTWSTH